VNEEAPEDVTPSKPVREEAGLGAGAAVHGARRTERTVKRGVRGVFHRLAHVVGLNCGNVETWWEGSGEDRRLMVGHRCAGCGRLFDVYEAYIERSRRTADSVADV
jgi:hypothetical protein